MEPLRELLRDTARKKWRLTKLQAESLRSLVIGGHWSQARLARAGYADDDCCLLCPGHVGTLAHRHWRCPHAAAAREEALDADLLQHLQACPDDDPFAARILVPRASLPELPPRDDSEAWYFAMGTQDQPPVVTGDVYCDGSCVKLSWWPEASRRAGVLL